MEPLKQLAQLVHRRNEVANEIARTIGRPALLGHVGEYIASKAFDIRLQDSASAKSIDGHFVAGSLEGKSVNIKWYGLQEHILDVVLDEPPDYYLVMTGPKPSTQPTARLWRISSVFLFESEELMTALRRRSVKLGTATSVANALWEQAEVYPREVNKALSLSAEQKRSLALFS